MKNLITGGAGFIGSWLASTLLELGEKVVIVDNLSTGDRDNIPDGAYFPGPLDLLTNNDQIDRLAANCDRIYHLAAAVGVDYVVKNPERVHPVNVLGTKIVAEIAKKHTLPVLFTSSSEVYGDLGGSLSENSASEKTSSKSPYAASKWEAENLLVTASVRFDFPVTIARLFNIVGPLQTWKYGMVVPTFVRQALLGQNLTVLGDGTQCRTFTDVHDISKALLDLMNQPRAMGRVVNLGGTSCLTINELASMIVNETRSESKIIHIPYNKSKRANYVNILDRKPDLSKAQELIDYNPIIPIETSLRNIIQHTRSCFADEVNAKKVSGWS